MSVSSISDVSGPSEHSTASVTSKSASARDQRQSENRTHSAWSPTAPYTIGEVQVEGATQGIAVRVYRFAYRLPTRPEGALTCAKRLAPWGFSRYGCFQAAQPMEETWV